MSATRILTALALALVLAACGNDTAPTAAAGTDSSLTLRRGNGAEPDTLDPQKSSGKWESDIIGEMIMGLTTDDAGGNTILGAAESYEVSDDGTVWTFKIRPDMNWSDGVPVTADDFVFAFHRILDPKTAAQYASLIYIIKGAQEINEGRAAPETLAVRAIDAKTLEIALRNPAPYVLELARHQTMAPVPRHIVEKYGDDWVKPQNIVVNGPYKPVEWIPNAHIKLAKNESFYDAANVQIETVYFYPISDQSVEVKRYQAGELDVTNSMPARQLPWARETFGDQVHVHTYLTTAYLQVNTLREPFTDLRVRRALSLAIDRERITGEVLNAGQRPAYALVPPGMANYTGAPQLDFKDTPMAERQEEARQLLAAAGFGPNKPLRFTYRYMDSLDGKRVAVAMQDMWKAVGIEAELFNSEVKVHYDALRTQDFDIAEAGWVADYDDPENYLFLLQSTSGQMNYSKYSNPEYDALMARAAVTRDLGERAKILEQAETIILTDMPIIPEYNGAYRSLVRPYVKGWVDNVGDWHRTRFLRIEREAS